MQVGDKTLRRRVYDILEMGGFGSPWGAFFDRFIILLIVANVSAAALQTVEEYAVLYESEFHLFEFISVMFFTVEYLARVWVCVERHADLQENALKTRLSYMMSPMAIVDIIAILPFYLVSMGTDMRFLRIFRLLRLLKIVRYSPGIASMFRVFYDERRALVAALIMMSVATVFSASIMYFVERYDQPDNFGNIPQSLWWAITTLTTVGYGDVTPVTPLGRLVGAAVMLFGLAFYAIPIGIIASAFTNELSRRDFVIRFGLVARVPLFSKFDSETVGELSRVLTARIVPAGTVLSHRGQIADGLYFVVSGDAYARFDGKEYKIPEGGFFGQVSLLMKTFSEVTIYTKTECKIMSLATRELEHMLMVKPELQKRLEEELEQHLDEYVQKNELAKEIRDELVQEHRDWMDRVTKLNEDKM